MLLRDADIVSAINAGTIVVSDIVRDSSGNIPLSDTSAVQASSLDLTIGKIFVPPSSPASPTDPEPACETGYQLMPGKTVVVETYEEITLPANIAGFGFPPSKLARNSILMTNPGHIDPGYSGRLNFTLINMGRESLSLQCREKIVSLLLIQLSQQVSKDYRARTGAPARRSHKGLLNRLSPDFASFSGRMEAAATSAVDKRIADFENQVSQAETKFDRSKLWIGGLTLLAAAGVTAFGASLIGAADDKDLKKLETRVQTIETTQDVRALSERLERMERALTPAQRGRRE